MQIPLFPLHTVLYPEGPLPLRIFEPRYLDMISQCLREGTPFGVVQIRAGSETGPASTFDIGTLAEVSDWYQGSDGILGITALGSERFVLQSRERQPDGLLRGEVQLLPATTSCPLPEEFLSLAQILDSVLTDLGRLYVDLPRRYEDAVWVGYRFAEILPFSAQQKQDCLEMTDPLQRLQLVRTVLRDARDVELV
ncbi:LON peptidase substrate-binding domain-containing protein [Woeseia oceani]|uniref:Lon N-terminal domain-containing protein n=1 Tax=Woeseia oceani TaxID=1548547 RepID=A0A193LIF5_9GAMM|nr:LON peptidase substrate-binding domain-containing protein [Woeseia oceani]ANO52223.1 hypothetical protein BA177_14400 [Woeseia oceani]